MTCKRHVTVHSLAVQRCVPGFLRLSQENTQYTVEKHVVLLRDDGNSAEIFSSHKSFAVVRATKLRKKGNIVLNEKGKKADNSTCSCINRAVAHKTVFLGSFCVAVGVLRS